MPIRNGSLVSGFHCCAHASPARRCVQSTERAQTVTAARHDHEGASQGGRAQWEGATDEAEGIADAHTYGAERDVWRATRHQRCLLRQTAAVLGHVSHAVDRRSERLRTYRLYPGGISRL